MMTKPKTDRPVLRQDGFRMVCQSCYLFNCWHGRTTPCDVAGCQCTTGNVREDDADYFPYIEMRVCVTHERVNVCRHGSDASPCVWSEDQDDCRRIGKAGVPRAS
jgi:hypothetical protein